jgi:hypothetical protein
VRTPRRTPVLLVAIAVTAVVTAVVPAAGAQSDDEPPSLVPIVPVQAPTPVALLGGLTSMVRAAFAATVEDGGDDGAVERSLPPPSDFDVTGVGSGHIEPSLELADGRLRSSITVHFASADGRVISDGTTTIDMSHCPDDTGLVHGSIVVTIDARPEHGLPPEFGFREIEADYEGTVNERAELTSFKWGDVDTAGSWTTSTQAVVRVDGERFEETERRTTVTEVADGGDDSDAIAEADGRANAHHVGALVETAMRGARALWRRSGCVSLPVLDGDSPIVQPGSSVQIRLAPTSALDGGRVDLPVTAEIDEPRRTTGTISPSHATGAPVEFEYTAPPGNGRHVRLHFESVTQRGIAERFIELTTAGDFKAVTSSDSPGFRFSGVKCGGPGGTWTLRSDVTGNDDPNGVDLTVDIDAGTLRGTVTGTRFLTEAGAPTQRFPITGTARFRPDAQLPQLELVLSTSAPGPTTRWIDFGIGDYCTNGEPDPDEVIEIER